MRYSKDLVRNAFEQYKQICKDPAASLHIYSPGDGVHFEIQNGKLRMTCVGAREAYYRITAFIDGYCQRAKDNERNVA